MPPGGQLKSIAPSSQTYQQEAHSMQVSRLFTLDELGSESKKCIKIISEFLYLTDDRLGLNKYYLTNKNLSNAKQLN